ncbi:MAG: hypothetical protein PHS62_03370 [Patescibacteria group bacterium]|nr:hypothetical protein [Patescibacteria group bacterium]
MSNSNHEENADGLENQDREQRANGEEKLCPFMSGPNGQMCCMPECKLYRKEPKGYECTLQELRAISWNTKKKK